jgi:hypothetical protein
VVDLEVVEERQVKKPFLPVVKPAAQKEEDSSYQVTVTVHPDLEKYPERLRDALQKACQTRLYKYLFALQDGQLPTHHQTYTIIVGTRIRSESTTFKTEAMEHNILDLGVANAKVLRFFAKHANPRLEKKSFQEQKHEGLTNPEFLELFSVRRGTLGWGLDADGCVSIYGSSLVEKKTMEYVWYVKAAGIKLEDAYSAPPACGGLKAG